MLDQPVLSRDVSGERLARVRELIAAADDDALADEVVRLGLVDEDVQALPGARRHALILRLIERGADGPLLVQVADNIAADALSWRAGRHLIGVATASETCPPRVLAVLADVAQREAGGAPAALVAVMRRTAIEYAKHPPAARCAPIRPWLDGEAGSLNVGEPWAEAAAAEAPSGDLLAHALAASGARPAPRWARRGADLVAELGGEQCRALIRRWLGLVPAPRTIELRRDGGRDPNRVPDPHNARALRGLLYLLAVTPPHPDDVAVVGRLAQYAGEKVPGHGPRSQAVAHACVYALERFTTIPALRELTRLRSLGQPPGIASALSAAIARRSVALGVGPGRPHQASTP
ncbi:hypothetical protein AB0M46_48705 [Dactylosporangium sp. NPDC051485]|uniref:hypothetical protein n=1 Tax=Dactylosporangium sp. NPDC051485 TaxID=3154846 RepID=UPI00341E4BF6